MSDIAERLRVLASLLPRDRGNDAVDDTMSEAADEIDRITRELAAARDKALEDAEASARQALMDAAFAHKHDKAKSSALFSAETYVTAAIRALKEKP